MGFQKYVKAAFNARPWGMFIPPNWAAPGVFGLLSLAFSTPGFLLIGAGLQFGLVLLLANNARFQHYVDALEFQKKQGTAREKVEAMVAKLSPDDQRRYRGLEKRCQSLLDQMGGREGVGGLQAHAEGLGRLLYTYLRLLLTRQQIQRALTESAMGESETGSIDKRIEELDRELKQDCGPDLQRSLSEQRNILMERAKRQKEAKGKVRFIEAELTRIQEQVELIREQLAVTADPEVLSRRIDQIGDTLGETSQWMKQQQEIYGEVDELVNEPPPLKIAS